MATQQNILKFVKKSVLLAGGTVFGFPAIALPGCYGRSMVRDIAQTTPFIERTAAYGVDGRKTDKDYAMDPNHPMSVEQLQRRYEATGDFRCGGKLSQANLVISNDLILTTGHSVFGEVNGDCTPIAPLDTCTFTVIHGGKTIVQKIEKVISAANGCPGAGQQIEGNKDWAILKLMRPMDPSIKPYRLRGYPVYKGEKVVEVAKSGDFYFTHAVKQKAANGTTQSIDEVYYPKHYADCETKDQFDSDASFKALGTDCAAAGYSSGGGVFDSTDKGYPPVLIGIMMGGKLGDFKKATPNTKPVVVTNPYDSQNWYSVMLPVDGDLRITLRKLSPGGKIDGEGSEL